MIAKRIPAESKSLLHFFYVVRLAQQGFFQLIAASHPSLEPQAVQYVCDTLISNSIRESRSNVGKDRLFYAETVWDVYTGLIDEREESVGKGFKTTYKDIMDAAHNLIDDAVSRPSSSSSKDTSSSSSKSMDTSSPPQTQPPIWFVMPYTSMIDPHMLTFSGSIPTLPLPSGNNNNQKRNNSSGRSSNNKRENRREDRHAEAKRNRNRDRTTDSPIKDVEEKTEKDMESIEKNEDNNHEDNESISDEEDKFADPELSDDEDEDDDDNNNEVKEEEEEDKENGESVSVETEKTNAVVEEEKKESPSNAVKEEEQVEGEQQKETGESEDAKANNSWLNFAASSTPPDSQSAHSSPRSSQSHQRTKKY